MKIKVANYTIETIDTMNLKVTREVDSYNKRTNTTSKVSQFVGYYGTFRDAVLSVIKDREISMEVQGSVQDAIAEYDKIAQDTLRELKQTLCDRGLK